VAWPRIATDRGRGATRNPHSIVSPSASARTDLTQSCANRTPNQFRAGVFRALARAEAAVPAATRGGFIAAGAAFDALAVVGKVPSSAGRYVLIVDSYMDAKALTDFAPMAPPACQRSAAFRHSHLQAGNPRTGSGALGQAVWRRAAPTGAPDGASGPS
jgi:hypothetical protein